VALAADPALDAAHAFATPGTLAALEPFPGGHIHAAHLVTYRHGGGTTRFLLQQLNTGVFPHPDQVMANIERVTAHLAQALARARVRDLDRRTLTLAHTRQGATWHRDGDGRVWRLYHFIEGAVARPAPRNAEDAAAAAAAFGGFQRLLADFPDPALHQTIPDFHFTPGRLQALEDAVDTDPLGRADAARSEIEDIFATHGLSHALVDAHLPSRVTHNDAKISNLLFDAETGAGLCVVDLDTVMPGFAVYDFGDLVRSMATRAAEDETDLSQVRLEPALVKAIAWGYLKEAGEFLSTVERSLLITAARVIVLEQGARFLADHLRGDLYYRISRPGHNLERARTQIRLLSELNAQAGALEREVARL
jgi:hypothetical protein